MAEKDYKRMQNDLSHGYIVDYCANKARKESYPFELNQIVSDFMGNKLLRFDTFHKDTKIMIHKDGTHIKLISNWTLVIN